MSDTPTTAASRRVPGTGRAWHLTARPDGWPVPGDFALRETPVPAPVDGQITVRNLYLSVDPYMRGRMSGSRQSYVAPFELDAPMEGGAVGVVAASRSDRFVVGDHVLHGLGWRDYVTLDADRATGVDPEAAPLSAYLGVLGMTGLTAYAGLTAVGGLRPGQTVFVSGAAGAVGSEVGQIAKLRGAARVVGSAGSAEKVRVLTKEYNFDAAFNYKDAPVADQLREAAPDGIDLYFDNVGGDHLEAAIGALNVHGRAVVCGMISAYNATEPPAAPRNLSLVIARRLRIEGMLVQDHQALRPQFLKEAGAWLRSGELKYRETTTAGIESAVDAFLGMLHGDNIGKMIVDLTA